MKEIADSSVRRAAVYSFKTIMALLGLMIALTCLEAVHKQAYSWELDSLTLRQKWFSSQNIHKSAPIMLVNVDNQTMGTQPYMRHFGAIFSRRAVAYALRFFNRTSPKAVVLDASFNSGRHLSDPEGDVLLANNVSSRYPVASALAFELKGNQDTNFDNQPPAVQNRLLKNTVTIQGLDRFPIFNNHYRYDSLTPPYDLLLQSPMRFFSANTSIHKTNLDNRTDDIKGLSRRWAPLSLFGNAVYPTLPLGVLLHGETHLSLSSDGWLRWKHGALNLGPSGTPLIKWYGHGVDVQRPIYPEFSFAEVVMSEISLSCQEQPGQTICKDIQPPAKPKLQPGQFRDQYVLIGFVMPNGGDQHPTIYGPKYPGVYILANTLDNALNNDFVHTAPDWLNLLMLFGLPALLAGMILRFRSALIGLLMTLTLSAGHFLFCVHAYNVWNLWVYAMYPILGMLACFSGMYVFQYVREYKKRQQMRFAFGKYVSPAVLQIIEQHPEKVTLGGERREMTFLFSDIRGFTTFSDQNSPEAVQQFLTQYFSTMNKIIMHQYRGSINKLIGDAIMAYWGFPLDNEDHAYLAVSAALAMKQAMLDWRNQTGKLPINIGIGINTGEAVIGNIGSDEFMDFTVIGDAVNVASRLESANKEYGTTIIISAATYEKVKDRIHARKLGWAELKGKDARVEVYEPLGWVNNDTPVREILDNL